MIWNSNCNNKLYIEIISFFSFSGNGIFYLSQLDELNQQKSAIIKVIQIKSNIFVRDKNCCPIIKSITAIKLWRITTLLGSQIMLDTLETNCCKRCNSENLQKSFIMNNSTNNKRRCTLSDNLTFRHRHRRYSKDYDDLHWDHSKLKHQNSSPLREQEMERRVSSSTPSQPKDSNSQQSCRSVLSITTQPVPQPGHTLGCEGRDADGSLIIYGPYASHVMIVWW